MKQEDINNVLKSRSKTYTIFYKDSYNKEYVHTAHLQKSEITVRGNHAHIRTMFGESDIEMDNIISIHPKFIDNHAVLSFGSDPELFFEKDGIMVPSTSILKQDTKNVTRDGFQVELHPNGSTCRQLAGNNIRACLQEARLFATIAGVKLSFALSYIVDSKVWKKTGNETKQFGCHPTMNVHEVKSHRSTGLREKFRAGGGHIHVGNLTAKEKKNLPSLVKIMDIVVGNTLVLLDRDEANITRRKNYGRAGEYRPKPYGLEYRVPSNFWLKHYVLWSLASGLIRNAVVISRAGLAEELIAKFDMKDVRNAINNNDFDLAMQNYNKYIEFLNSKMIPFMTGISITNYKKFTKWVTSPDPLSKLGDMTNESIYEHWNHLSGISQDGFEKFISKMK